MKIIICGAGTLGITLAEKLASEDHDVTLIDSSEEVVNKVSKAIDAKVYLGFVSHPDVLANAGVASADVVIAVSTQDEINMVTCQIAHSIFKVPIKIARIRNQSYLAPDLKGELYKNNQLPINYIISPEAEVTQAILERVDIPGAINATHFRNSKISIIETEVLKKSKFSNETIENLHKKYSNIVIFGINRDKEFMYPDKDTKIKAGDKIYFATDFVSKAVSLFGHTKQQDDSFTIVGGGLGSMLAERLVERGTVTLIERDDDIAECVAEMLPQVAVIKGDCLDKEILEEAGIADVKTVIAVTDSDNTNILTGLLAKRYGTKRSIVLVKNRDFAELIPTIDIDAIINPSDITVFNILQYLQMDNCASVIGINGKSMEISEVEIIHDGQDIDGKIITISRHGRIVSDTELQKYDKAIVLNEAEL